MCSKRYSAETKVRPEFTTTTTMADQLATYLNDHLAGACVAIDVLEHMWETCDDAPLRQFAADLLREIESDRAVLQRIVEQTDSDTGTLKQAAAWVAEKASRLKLRLGSEDRLGIFEALEALSLGILGKRALWRALEAIAPADVRLQGIDFSTLIKRAESQYNEVEGRRLEAATLALRSGVLGDSK